MNGTQWVVPDPTRPNWYWPSDALKERAWAADPQLYKQAAADPIAFWAEQAEGLEWFERWRKVYEDEPYAYRWFVGGKLNLSYNCLDRHVEAGKGG
ncbi:MAG TPA: hypothetical protein ENN53_01600, partial [Candidatus Acetothermia bacterium]|nr:hypothetical protein [Candidatus Acetothermia bacterium]